MELICNTRCLDAPLTGVQRYTLKNLQAFPEQIKTISPASKNARGMKGHLWEQFILPGKTGSNLLWSPSNSGPINHKRQVVTIHDVVSVDHPEWFNANYTRWYNYMLPRLCKKASHIITISEFSRSRITELFRVPAANVSLIYNGADQRRACPGISAPQPIVPFKRFVLSVGSIEPRKNVPMLLRAWQNIEGRIPGDIGLVVVGTGGNKRIFKDAGISTIPDKVHFTGHISDEEMAQLYSTAIFFVYLSVYEGFGLPPLEAMAAGLPVLTGALTSLPEVVGDGGLMIDPYSLSECEANLIRLATEPGLRKQLASKALLQAQKFSWADTASRTWHVLQSFL